MTEDAVVEEPEAAPAQGVRREPMDSTAFLFYFFGAIVLASTVLPAALQTLFEYPLRTSSFIGLFVFGALALGQLAYSRWRRFALYFGLMLLCLLGQSVFLGI